MNELNSDTCSYFSCKTNPKNILYVDPEIEQKVHLCSCNSLCVYIHAQKAGFYVYILCKLFACAKCVLYKTDSLVITNLF